MDREFPTRLLLNAAHCCSISADPKSELETRGPNGLMYSNHLHLINRWVQFRRKLGIARHQSCFVFPRGNGIEAVIDRLVDLQREGEGVVEILRRTNWVRNQFPRGFHRFMRIGFIKTADKDVFQEMVISQVIANFHIQVPFNPPPQPKWQIPWFDCSPLCRIQT